MSSFTYRCLWCRFFFFSSRRRHTRWPRDWSSDVCSSDLGCRGAAGDRGDRPDRPGALAPAAGLAAPDEPAPLGRVLRGLLPPVIIGLAVMQLIDPGSTGLTSFAVTSTTARPKIGRAHV